ncbi:hypothetical protein JTB14_002466 [Gonioctena quinquepunctata]|nr:hypothetical protein JTB14_002466 [Gonioctena quinquepunctata]
MDFYPDFQPNFQFPLLSIDETLIPHMKIFSIYNNLLIHIRRKNMNDKRRTKVNSQKAEYTLIHFEIETRIILLVLQSHLYEDILTEVTNRPNCVTNKSPSENVPTQNFYSSAALGTTLRI